MDERRLKLGTPEKCEIFAKNATERDHPDLAKEARQRAIQLRAEQYGAKTTAEKEAWEAICAYEEILTKRHGKKTRASRTRQMIKRHGIIAAIERAVNRPTETQGYETLVAMGLEERAFEALILRHPDRFGEESIAISRKRVDSWRM